VGGWLGKSGQYSFCTRKNHFAILIPTYKEDHIILHTINVALEQDYPKDKYDIVVIADQLRPDTLERLELMPIKVIKVDFEKSTKAKSLKFALQRLPNNLYDSILILDSDNLLGKGCLEKANHALNSGFKMVQLHRTAKNRNTATAILDAISEEIGNIVHRKGHRALGLSATLIGSGMAFNYILFKSVMLELNIEDNPAEDREINAEFLKRGYVCEYVQEAFVYDEKVQSGRILEKQRTRWISAQLQYAKHFWMKDFKHIFSYNIYYFDYAFQTLLLPRVMLLMLSFIMALLGFLLYLVTGFGIYPGSILWGSLFMIFILSLGVNAYPYLSLKEAFTALRSLPATFWSFFKASLKSRSSQQEFIHTPKEYIKRSS